MAFVYERPTNKTSLLGVRPFVRNQRSQCALLAHLPHLMAHLQRI